MRSLFIVGNGFDLAHGLKTSYEDFRKYLQRKYPEASEDEFVLPEIYTTSKGDEFVEDVEAVSFLIRIISNIEGERWQDMETTLGLLDFSECFDWVDYPLDKDGDIDPWKQVYVNQDIASNLLFPIIEILRYFSDWIHTIKIDNRVLIKKDLINLIDTDKDLFLTFNYTETLELIYRVKKVCHIHGKKGEKLLLGHGNDNDYYEYNISNYVGAENDIQQIHENLRKDTIGAIEKHKYFFDDIDSTVDKVYSYGFSFSEVDNVYIKSICERLTNPDVVWYLNDYDNQKQRNNYKNIIRKCGYKGRFDIYSIR